MGNTTRRRLYRTIGLSMVTLAVFMLPDALSQGMHLRFMPILPWYIKLLAIPIGFYGIVALKIASKLNVSGEPQIAAQQSSGSGPHPEPQSHQLGAGSPSMGSGTGSLPPD